jgi:hypothetical protein
LGIAANWGIGYNILDFLQGNFRLIAFNGGVKFELGYLPGRNSL